MLGPLDYVIWLAAPLLEIGVAVCIVWRREFRNYSVLLLQMVAGAAGAFGQCVFLRQFGYTSLQYFYYYYYTDVILCIFMFLLIIQLYERVFTQFDVRQQIHWAAGFLLLLTAGFSAAVTLRSGFHLTAGFVDELEQNLNFVGVVLIYALWGAVMRLKLTRTRLAQVILVLGIYFSATTVTYAVTSLFPATKPFVLHWMPPLLALWLPLAWTYAFLKAPEVTEARIEAQSGPKVLPAWQEVTVR